MIKQELLRGGLNSFYYPPADSGCLPSIIMVEPTSACNLKCSMCYVQQHAKDIHYLSVSDFEKIMKQFPRIREIIFCGIGEPLLNKDVFNMIKIAKNNDIRFINLISNGKLLDERIASEIVKSGIDRVQISVHSFDPEIFSQVRNESASNLEKLKQDIKRLIAIKKEENSPLKVCCNAVVTKFNYGDLIKFIEEAKGLGVDRVEFIQMTTASDNLKNINAPLNQIGRVTKEARKAARKSNIEIGFLNGNEYGRCYQMWDFIMIHSDGNVSPCNGIFPTEKIGVGNILRQPVEEIWNSDKYRRLRQLVKKGKLEYCKYCESGYAMEGKNHTWIKNHYFRPLKRLFKRKGNPN